MSQTKIQLWHIFAFIGVVAVPVLAWLLINTEENALKVDLRSPGVSQPKAERPPLLFAIAPVLSPERTVDDYITFVNYVSSQLRRPIRLVQRKTYGEINELLHHSKVQLALICTGAYLHATAVDRLPIEILAVPVYPDGPVYYSLIVVGANSGIKSFSDLRGRSFAFSDPLSLSGHYYPLSFLIEQGLDPHTFFPQTIFTYSHNGSLKAVLDGIVHGAAVDSLVYDFEIRRNPALEKKLRVIHRSPPLGINPLVVPASLEPSLRESLRKVFLEMNRTPEGQRLLSTLGIERFDTPPPNLYDHVTELFTQVRRYLEKKQ